MFKYLYYKLYQAALKSSLKDIPQIAAAAWFGALIGANIFVINGFLAKTIALPFLFSNPKLAGLFAALLIALVMIYFRAEKRTIIIEGYSQENEKTRKRGNAITAVYVGMSFLLIFVVAFFKSGKL